MYKYLFKWIGILLFVQLPLLGLAQFDTVITTYNFNNLNVGNLNNKDNWKTSISGTTSDIQVKSAHSHDGSKALYFPQNGAGVNGGMNRALDSIFPNFNFSDTTAIYYLYVDFKPEWWGTEFGIGYDSNNDGIISSSNNGEKALRLLTKTNNSSITLYLPNGVQKNYSGLSGGWRTFEFRLKPGDNNAKGFLRLRYKAPTATSWTTIANNVNMGLDTSATNNKNAANWDHVFGYFTGTGSGMDNLEFWKLTPIITYAPTDILISYDTISEDQPVGRFIATLSAIDQDTNDTFSYSFIAGLGDDDNNLFRISNDSLFSDTVFDYEDTIRRTIRIEVKDSYSNVFEKQLTINILDIIEWLGISNNESNILRIYPNPSSGEINLESGELLDGEIQIYNSLGSIVSKKLLSGRNKYQITLPPTLTNGVYTIKFIGSKRVYAQQIILERE